ncbi:hypothetical protein N7G274_008122 [Stereocaulon virgatum]|uniref:Uncharacterized protein n=1 Tax=Stereocaulon virgatum TaxID=373712 RepID=A0ABR4A0B8_9LECA
MNPQEHLGSEQPRPDSATVPDLTNDGTVNTRCDKRDQPITGLHSEWLQAMYGERRNTPGAGTPRIDYGPVTSITGLCSHAPTDEERAWMSRLTERVKMRTAQKRARDVEKLLRKSCLTKEKEMREIFWSKGSTELQYKKSMKARRAARVFGISVKAYFYAY